MATNIALIRNDYTMQRLGIEPSTEICLNCKHFHQHYSKSDSVMLALHCGHCAFPRMKFREVTDTCEHFQVKEGVAKL